MRLARNHRIFWPRRSTTHQLVQFWLYLRIKCVQFLWQSWHVVAIWHPPQSETVLEWHSCYDTIQLLWSFLEGKIYKNDKYYKFMTICHLPNNCVMTTVWELLDYCLTITQWLADNCLTTTWWLPNDCLTTAWRLPDCLTTSWQLRLKTESVTKSIMHYYKILFYHWTL